MRLSAFSIVDEHPGPGGPVGARLPEVVDLGGVAEAAGLSAIWIAEHHFNAGGVCPSPPVLLGALSAATRRIRLGAMVSVLTLHDAVEVAEEYAMVDRISNGRLNLGLGSGYVATELAGFGVDPATKRERFDAAYDTLLAAFAGRPVRTRAGVGPVTVNVRPVQEPHPPLWIAAQRPEAFPHIARRGVSAALVPYATLANVDELAALIREYRSHVPAGTRTEVAAALHLYAGPDVAAARTALQRYLDSRRTTQGGFFEKRVQAHPEHAQAETVEATGFALLGSPRSVRDRLEAIAHAGVDEVLGIFDFGGLAPRRVHASVRGLARAFRA